MNNDKELIAKLREALKNSSKHLEYVIEELEDDVNNNPDEDKEAELQALKEELTYVQSLIE